MWPDRRLLLGLSAFWATCALLATLAFNASIALGSIRLADPISMWRRVALQASPWVAAMILTPPVLVLCLRFTVTRTTWPAAVAIHAAGLSLFAYASILLSATINYLLRGEAPQWLTLKAIGARIATSGMVIVTEYAVVVGAAEAFRYAVEARTRAAQADHLARQSAELERDLAAARLTALRQQLQPHFLFNALNAVTSLIDERPADAQRLVTRLSELLRISLEQGADGQVSLGEELDLTDRYIAVEQARYGDRLIVRYDVDDAALGAEVPSFLLQPLVENAVRHGVARRPEGGVIEVAARRDRASLRLSIRNDMPESDAADPAAAGSSAGLGLPHTRARLASLYGRASSLAAGADGAGHFQVVMTIPWRSISSATA